MARKLRLDLAFVEDGVVKPLSVIFLEARDAHARHTASLARWGTFTSTAATATPSSLNKGLIP
jgi:hypothetical protein